MRTQEIGRKAGLLSLLFAAVLVLASCGAAGSGGGEGGHGEMDHGSDHGSGEAGGDQGEDHGSMDHDEMGKDEMGNGSEEMPDTVAPSAAGVEMDMRAEPASPEPGEPTRLVYCVEDAESGEAVTELPVDHERQMHLIAVSRDLERFKHIHPLPNGRDFAVTAEFREGGDYVLFNEFVRDGQKVLDRRQVEVGAGGGEASLSLDTEPKTVDGVKVSLEAPDEIRAGEEAAFTYTLEENGTPVDDLEPYLGAPAHVAVVSEDTREFAHTHGEDGASGSGGSEGHGGEGEHAGHSGKQTYGPRIGFHHTFDEPGAYKVWAEFNHQGGVIAVPFVVEVE